MMDRYSSTTETQCELISGGIAHALACGSLGVSYGMRYSPGTIREEIVAAVHPCCSSGKMIAAHIRSDAQEAFAIEREIFDVCMHFGIPVQLSHIGSMTGFNQMEGFLRMIDVNIGPIRKAEDCADKTGALDDPSLGGTFSEETVAPAAQNPAF